MIYPDPKKKITFLAPLSATIPSLQERFAFLEQVFAHPQLRQQWRRPPESEIRLWLLASRATLRNGFRDESAWYRNVQPGWKRMTALVEQWAAARRLQRKKCLKSPAASKAEVCEKGRKHPSTTPSTHAFLVHGNKKAYWINVNYFTVYDSIYIYKHPQGMPTVPSADLFLQGSLLLPCSEARYMMPCVDSLKRGTFQCRGPMWLGTGPVEMWKHGNFDQGISWSCKNGCTSYKQLLECCCWYT